MHNIKQELNSKTELQVTDMYLKIKMYTFLYPKNLLIGNLIY